MSFSVVQTGYLPRPTIVPEVFLFPGGEVGVKLDPTRLDYLSLKASSSQTIVARLQTPADVMTLVLLTDALRRFHPAPVRLFMPYVPYARQDRVCVRGESFSLKAFAGIINSLAFESVTVIDPHSDVVGAVFDRLRIITQLDVIHRYDVFIKEVFGKPVTFVSPDAGANKKTAELAKYFGHAEFVRADKKRDLATGQILETVVYADDLTGRTLVIADDICDGGRTFIELAKVLKAKGAAKVILYVTHGIFSKGIAPLLANGIDDIYTTTSYTHALGNLNALDVEEAFLT